MTTLMPPPTFRDRALGVLLGGAIGDALGYVVEFDRDPTVLDREIGTHPPAHLPVDKVSDDTQMTLFTCDALIRTHLFHITVEGQHRITFDAYERMVTAITHQAYKRWLATQNDSYTRQSTLGFDGWLITDRRLWASRAPGNTCMSALMSGTAGTVAHRINTSMGCGGVMRTAPIGLLYEPGTALRLGDANAAITHGHDNGIAPAGALAAIIAYLVHTQASLRDAVTRTLDLLAGVPYSPETTNILRAAVHLADLGKVTRDHITERLGEGWVGHEALAIALACALAHENDPAHAIWAAANHPGDSDSTAAITGQLLGAAHGIAALPSTWVAEVELADTLTAVADALTAVALTGDTTALARDFPFAPTGQPS